MSFDETIYECDICSGYHPWSFNGDCRDDENRYGSPEEYEEKFGMELGSVEVRSMEERVQADYEDSELASQEAQ